MRKSKAVTISLPIALEWKLSQLSQWSGIPKSVLLTKALLILVSDFQRLCFQTESLSLPDIEQEYAQRED